MNYIKVPIYGVFSNTMYRITDTNFEIRKLIKEIVSYSVAKMKQSLESLNLEIFI